MRAPWRGGWAYSKSPNPLHHAARQPAARQQTARGWVPLPPPSCLQIPIILRAITGSSPGGQYPISPRGHHNICRAGLHGCLEQRQPRSSYYRKHTGGMSGAGATSPQPKAGAGGLCSFPVPCSSSSCRVASLPRRVSRWGMRFRAHLHGQLCSCGPTAVRSCPWTSWLHPTSPAHRDAISSSVLPALFEPLPRAKGSGPAPCSHARSVSVATIVAQAGSKGSAVPSDPSKKAELWRELLSWPLQPALLWPSSSSHQICLAQESSQDHFIS